MAKAIEADKADVARAAFGLHKQHTPRPDFGSLKIEVGRSAKGEHRYHVHHTQRQGSGESKTTTSQYSHPRDVISHVVAALTGKTDYSKMDEEDKEPSQQRLQD